MRNLRLGAGVIGTFLPVTLIIANLILDDKVIVPASMSGTYYTSARNLFAGSLCTLGVFLTGYRGDTRLQDLRTSFAGLCALLVAFAPTAPPSPKTEAAWVSYLHHSAAGALIFTPGLFCLTVFAQLAKPRAARPAMADHPSMILYLACGILVLVSGAFALYTGVWPTSWSTGWSSLYLFEAVAVFAFGSAWIAEPAGMIWPELKLPLSRTRSRLHPPYRLKTAQHQADYPLRGSPADGSGPPLRSTPPAIREVVLAAGSCAPAHVIGYCRPRQNDPLRGVARRQRTG